MTPIEAAADIIDNDREGTYGDPGVNIRRIAALWSAYLGVAVTAEDVCWMMVLHKASRAKHRPDHRDNEVDAIGYIALIDRMRGSVDRKREREPFLPQGSIWYSFTGERYQVTGCHLYDVGESHVYAKRLIPGEHHEPTEFPYTWFVDNYTLETVFVEERKPVIEAGSVWRGKRLEGERVVTRVDDWKGEPRIWFSRTLDGDLSWLPKANFLEGYGFVRSKDEPDSGAGAV